MKPTPKQIAELNKRCTTLLASYAGKLKGECKYCGGEGNITIPESGHPSTREPRDIEVPCPHCAKLREIVDNYRIPKCQFKNTDRCYSPGECDTCGYLADISPTHTIQTLSQILRDMGKWEGFVYWLQEDESNQLAVAIKFASIMTIDELFIQAVISYIESEVK